MPEPMEYPEHEQGYVIALITFLGDVPTLDPLQIELAVGSKEHSFAGRFDLRGALMEEQRVVTKVYPQAQPKTTRIPQGIYLWEHRRAPHQRSLVVTVWGQ